MKEQLISFETSKLAKEKGIIFKDIFPFNYSCYLITGKLKNADAFKEKEKLQDNIPTQALLQKWFRKKHFINIGIDFTEHGWVCIVRNHKSNYHFRILHLKYERVLEVGLQEALKLI